MANLEDIQIPSISDMNPDEAIEYLRQIRLSRRTSKATPKTVTKKREAKARSETAIKKMSPEQAAELLKLLEE